MKFIDLPYTVYREEKASPFIVRYRPFKIFNSFKNEKDAKAEQRIVSESIDTLAEYLPLLSVDNYREHLSPADWAMISGEELHPKIEAALCYVAPSSGENLNAKQRKNVTVGLAARLCVQSRIDLGKPFSNPGRILLWAKSDIAGVKPQSVTREMILKARNKMQKEKSWSNSTANTWVSELSSVWTFMIDEMEIMVPHRPRAINKSERDRLPTVPNRTVAYTDKEVVTAIKIAYKADKDARKENAATVDFLGPLVELFSLTGIRNDFLASLRWDEIESLHGGAPRIGKTMKRGKYVNVPLIPRAREILIDMKKRDLSDEWVFPSPRKDGSKGYADRWDSRFKRLLTAAAERGEIRYLAKPIHAFRAYVATRLADEGFSAEEIGGVLGIDARTATGYINDTEKQQLAKAAKLAQALGQKGPSPAKPPRKNHLRAVS